MKLPQRPPSTTTLFKDISVDRLFEVLRLVPSPLVSGEYMHWDDLRRRPPPEGVSHAEWWTGLKYRRERRQLPLLDKAGASFAYGLPDPLFALLHRIDQQSSGRIEAGGTVAPLLNEPQRDRYYVSSLIEEALTSSQIEGAVTTREVARAMVRENRAPRTRSEQMVLNNFRAMQRIGELRSEPLSEALVMEIHEIVSRDALDKLDAAGRYRRGDEPIEIADDSDGEIAHIPPDANELPERMRAMCEFANAPQGSTFVHPVVRAMTLHFWLAYDHPFVDGNGRTARALFYWSMLRADYWLFEFVSISHSIRKATAQYYRAFQHTEADDNDLTYFLLWHARAIQQSIDALIAHIAQKAELAKHVGELAAFNERQVQLLEHASRNPSARYTIEEHRATHDVVYQTARTDLLSLVESGFLTSERVGKKMVFASTPKLNRALSRTRR